MSASGRPVRALVLAAAMTGLTASTAFLLRLDAPGPKPEGLASDGTHLWVSDFVTSNIDRLLPTDGSVVASYPAPGPQPEGLAWDGTHLWAASWATRRIYRLAVSDTALHVVRDFPAPGGARPVGLTWDGAALWLTTWEPMTLLRLDPVTGAVLRSRDLEDPEHPVYPADGVFPEDLAWNDRGLWITDWFAAKIFRLDPETLELLETLPSPGPRSVGLAFHQGTLWNGDTQERALFQLEATPVGVVPTTWGALKRLKRGGLGS